MGTVGERRTLPSSSAPTVETLDRQVRHRTCGTRLRYGDPVVASPQTQTTPQRLAAIREQMSLLTDYL
jgi:hypothetical protein